MWKLTLSLFLTGTLLTARSAETPDTALLSLNKTIQSVPVFDAAKEESIRLLRLQYLKQPSEDITGRYHAALQLFEAYKVFHYDSAFHYAKQLSSLAVELNDPPRLAEARIKMAFTLLSSGLFKETLDSLGDIRTAALPDSTRADYYALMGRYYYDLADFDNDAYHSPLYNQKANGFIDSALLYYPKEGFSYNYFRGLKEIRSGKKDSALTDFRRLLEGGNLTDHQVAIVASTLSDIYIQNNQTDTAIQLLIQAAMADIRSSTKETAAIFNLSQLLYRKGDVKSASDYIEQAIADATFYGARQRKVQVSAILPLIEGEKLKRVEAEKKAVVTYAVITTLLLLLVLALAFIIFRQIARLKAAKLIISEAHSKEQAINHELQVINEKLSEANSIKEAYIGYFFNVNAAFFAKIERFKKVIELKINERKMDEIRFHINNINVREEKNELLKNFDKVFLKLFPGFVEQFNALFKEEDRVILKDGELLNNDLRIFALIRMGIHDNDKIADILEYSGNTVKAYKSKIKNKSILPNEAFEQAIMQIKAF
ncbi:DUF6377 domain-containing protein [Flavihumibacter petaseus]|uniref:DUF6377 domain-containing protein n=1 Tax=Flavihumibacter petaseus NBRC 106054 TaxID=1220578 RepID=A0A0E9MU95_9BACT|nr:DUF6377 domain-containing protein [Flavihumibacter petaseus]GAO41342.1 hypothetical protein FPE01S_01_03540 [Flavihumibacter petaseus NBRC 106054]